MAALHAGSTASKEAGKAAVLSKLAPAPHALLVALLGGWQHAASLVGCFG